MKITRHHLLSIILVCVVSSATGYSQETSSPGKISFNQDIRSILSAKCFACHGPDPHSREANLRLDTEDGGAKVARQDKDNQLLRRILSTDPDIQMPPPDSKLALTAKEKKLLQAWVEQGAPYEGHWAFLTPSRPPLPSLDTAWDRWAANEVDRFVAQQLIQRQWKHSPPAHPRELARRVALDLTGMPPSIEQVNAFAANPTMKEYEALVDALLDSPRYGEHQARYWLDAARYADTNGYQYDLERNQWVWRDWVIHAFNRNQPFDQFTIEQLAGDLLPDATDQERLATGFHRNHPITIEGGVIDEEYRTEYVVDRVVTTSTVWLGLTMTCSRCHDHKYDPITQREFYEFFAFFNNVPERGMRGFSPQAKISSPLAESRNEELKSEVEAAQRAVDDQLQENAFGEWRERRLKQLAQGWRDVDYDHMDSSGGATFQPQSDASVLVAGANAPTDTYTLTIPIPTSAAGIRLEAIPDKSTVNGGTGRGSNGNFVLTELVATFKPEGQADFQPVKFQTATADYSQKDFSVSLAIDGKQDRKGWAVDGHQKIEQRTATFRLERSVSAGTLKLQLVHKYGLSHQIARFRIRVWSHDSLPPDAEEELLLGLPQSKLSAKQRSGLTQLLARNFGTPRLQSALARLAAAESELDSESARVPETMVMSELTQPRPTHILLRGEYDKPGEEVHADTPQALPAMPNAYPKNRLGLARWLVSREHPLTSRVTVNRFWQQLFGRGLVATSEDFGSQGSWPTHPQLLDWLAVDFMESGWDVKRLMKTMVMSSTYRQSGYYQKTTSADPDNRWLSRGPRMRLDAEVIRDSALAAAGLLQAKVGGPSVFPYHPQGLWQEINNRPGYSRTYKRDSGAGLYRRSLYTFWKRTVPPPSMAVFDAPTREFCLVRRSRTNTPLQAFVLLNDPQFVEAARALATRSMQHRGPESDDDAQMREIFLALFSRAPSAAETRVLLDLLNQRRERYAKDSQARDRLLDVGEAPVPPEMDRAELAAWTAIARTVINLSEFVTKP